MNFGLMKLERFFNALIGGKGETMIYHCCRSPILRGSWIVVDDQARIESFKDDEQLHKRFGDIWRIFHQGFAGASLQADPILRLIGDEGFAEGFWFEHHKSLFRHASGIMACGTHQEKGMRFTDRASLKEEEVSWAASSVLVYAHEYSEMQDCAVFAEGFALKTELDQFNRKLGFTIARNRAEILANALGKDHDDGLIEHLFPIPRLRFSEDSQELAERLITDWFYKSSENAQRQVDFDAAHVEVYTPLPAPEEEETEDTDTVNEEEVTFRDKTVNDFIED